MISPLIISRLIEAGYDLFLPINGSGELVIEASNHQLLRCHCQCASLDKAHSPLVRVPQDAFERGIFLAIYDPSTKSVWLIPPDQIESRQVIRLGKKYEEYILPEPISLSWREQRDKRSLKEESLKTSAQDAALKLFGER